MKISNIPSLKGNDNLKSDFTVKAELCNSYFATHCTLIDNSCKLPVFKCNGKHRLNSFELMNFFILCEHKGLPSGENTVGIT